MNRFARWGRVVLLGTTSLLTVAGVAGTQVVRVPPPTAAELLANTRAYIHAHGSAQFTGDMTVTYVDDQESDAGPGELGSRRTSHAQMRGSLDDGRRMQMVVNSGKDGLTEMIFAADSVFVRYGDSAGELQRERYAKYPLSDESKAGQAQFFDFGRALENAVSPVVRARQDGRTTVSAKVDPHKVFGAQNNEVTSVAVRFVVAGDHTLTSLRESFHGPEVDGVITLSFTQWGRDTRVAAPSAEEIDATPGINEEALAAYRGSTVMIPSSIPSGWEVDYADVIPAEESDEGCAQTEIDIDPIDSDYSDTTPYVSIYSLPASCTDASAGEGATPFTAGSRHGNIATDETGSFAEVRIDANTVIQIDTNLSPADVAKIVQDLVPFVPTGKPIAGTGAAPTTSV